MTADELNRVARHEWESIDPFTVQITITYWEFCQYVSMTQLPEFEELSIGEQDAVQYYHWIELRKAVENMQRAKNYEPMPKEAKAE